MSTPINGQNGVECCCSEHIIELSEEGHSVITVEAYRFLLITNFKSVTNIITYSNNNNNNNFTETYLYGTNALCRPIYYSNPEKTNLDELNFVLTGSY